jgi:ABC-type transporter MlaC component
MNGPKVDTALDFRLENHSDQWLVYDLVIDGTSIVGNYRAQFSQILYDNTYAGNGIWYSYRGWDPLEMGMGTQM